MALRNRQGSSRGSKIFGATGPSTLMQVSRFIPRRLYVSFSRLTAGVVLSAFPFALAAQKTALHVDGTTPRSEEHTSELQSHVNLVCRLLLEKKKKKDNTS